MSATSILINVGAQTAQAVRELDKVNSALESQMTTGEKWKQGFQKAGPVAAGAIAAVAGGFLVATRGAEEAQKATDALNQVFGQMGYEENAKAANEYADALEKSTGIEAEAIKGAQTKLATFSDLAASQELLARTTLAAADLSAAGFGEVGSVAVGLGKALQDPIKGMSLLTKQGSLTAEEQKKIADQFAKTGDKAAAQESILAALEKQVGGVAEASATSSDKLGNAFGSIADAVGASLLPAFEAITPYLESFADWAANNSEVILIIGGIIAGLAAAVLLVNAAMAVWGAIAGVVTAVNAVLGTSFTLALGPVLLIVAAIAAVIAIGILLYKNWDKISAWIGQTWESIKSKAVSVWNGIKEWFANTWAAIKTKAVELFDSIKTAVSEKITAVITFARELPGKVLAAIGDVTKTLFQKGIDLIMGLVKGYLSIWGTVLEFAADIGLKIAKAVGNVGRALYEKGQDLIQGFINGIKSMAGSILNAIRSILPGPLKGLLGNALGVNSMTFSTSAMSSTPSTRASGVTTVININGAVDPEATARQVERLLSKHTARQGRQPGSQMAVAW